MTRVTRFILLFRCDCTYPLCLYFHRFNSIDNFTFLLSLSPFKIELMMNALQWANK